MRAPLRPVLLVLALSASPLWAVPYQFGFSSLSSPASSVAFNGSTDTFNFVPDGGNSKDFVISGSDFGDLDGLFGSISGTFTIGTIFSAGPLQQAAVTGSGQLSIFDSSGSAITADLVWEDIFTLDLGSTLGGLNTLGTVNLTNFSGYSGSNARLQSFTSNGGSIGLSLALGQGNTLIDLTADGATHANAYSGSVTVESTVPTVPDSPVGLWLAGIVWLGLAAVASRRGLARA